MFELSSIEKSELLSNTDRLATLKYSYAPIMVFTEQGVAMLSSVLNSDKAIQANIEIMRTFVTYRLKMLENNDLRKEIERLGKTHQKSMRGLVFGLVFGLVSGFV